MACTDPMCSVWNRGGRQLRPRFQYRLWNLIVAIARLSLAMAYVGSYS
jgi:hypothetical protein